jgi:glycosyltransferase involved in cell wall biosynthesis
MDPDHPIFSHQYEIVLSLSRYFESVTVITGSLAKISLPPNVNVFVSKWVEGKRFTSVVNFISVFVRVFKSAKPNVIFSHMTDVQASIAAPFAFFYGTPHFLWYAHAKKSIYLRWVTLWSKGIVSSTKGSCPSDSRKLTLIGQSIDPDVFNFSSRRNFPPKRFVHVGRLDPSKNILEIIDTLRRLYSSNSDITLTLVGAPSSGKARSIYDEILTLKNSHDLDWLTIVSNVPRKDLPSLLSRFDCFIHAYRGSLDKVLIEATMCGLPVITINQEYINEFESWSEKVKPSLHVELNAFMSADKFSISDRLERNRSKSIDRHSLDSWILSLVKILSVNV